MSSEDNTDTAALLAGRESVYGNRVDNMTRVAEMWNGYLGTDIITPADVAMMFTLYKAYRFKITPDYSDNINDVLGYAEMVREVQEATGGLIHAETVKEYLEKKAAASTIASEAQAGFHKDYADPAVPSRQPDWNRPAGISTLPRHPYENVERDAERDSMEAWRNREEKHNG